MNAVADRIDAAEYQLIAAFDEETLECNERHILKWLAKLESETSGQFTAVRCWQRFMAGHWQAWLVYGVGGCVGLYGTAIICDDSDRMICQTLFMVGEDHRRWMQTYGVIEEWAKEGGCVKIMNYGRKGLGRTVLAAYKASHWVFEKELIDADHR